MEIIKTEQEFEKLIDENKIVVVDFFAEWCGPCKMLTPIFAQVSGEMSNEIKFVKINVDEFESIANKFAITSIPTLIVFKNGKNVSNISGFVNKETLINFINEAKDK